METAHMPARAAPARREALPVRLRPHLGLRRALHDAGRPALPAGRKAGRPTRTIRSRTRRRRPKEKALALRGLAQKGDPLAVELFDFQARAMGLHIANLVAGARSGVRRHRRRADGPREHHRRVPRALPRLVRETARPHLWPVQRDRLTVVAVDAGRAVAGDRRRAGRAVSQPALSVPPVHPPTPPERHCGSPARAPSRYRCVTSPT